MLQIKRNLLILLSALLFISIAGCRDDTNVGGTDGGDLGDADDSGHSGDGDDESDGESDADNPVGDCTPSEYVAPTENYFVNISEESGIEATFDPDRGISASHNTSHVVQFVDINGDGFDDVVMHNFFTAASGGPRHHVLLNNGDSTFTEISETTNLFSIQAQVFAFADIDNDGDQDLFAGAPQPLDSGASNQIYLNDGDGVFTEVEDPGFPPQVNCCRNAGAVFADYDNDGNLDLFLLNGITLEARMDELYFGNGDGTFTNALSNLSGNTGRPSNGATACDYDNDGDQDIFVSNYAVSYMNGHNVLWENDGNGNFTNVAEARGYAYQRTGNYLLESTGFGQDDQPSTPYIGSNGFGVTCADINNDGLLDIYNVAISHPDMELTRQWSDPTLLLINQGPEGNYSFVNEFQERNLQYNEGDLDGSAADFDNDGRLDITAQRDPKYEGRYTDIELQGWFGLMHQLPDGTFENVSFTSGVNDTSSQDILSKGAGSHAWSDIDHDGDLDLLIGLHYFADTLPENGRPSVLFRNDIGHQNTWLAVRLEGDGVNVNRDAIGAVMTLHWSDFQVTRRIEPIRGDWAVTDTRVLHFGIADHGCDFSAEVVWPNGESHTISAASLGTNGYVRVTYPNTVTVE